MCCIILAAERKQKSYSTLWNEHTCSNSSCTQQFHICNFMDTVLSNLLHKITPFQHTVKYKHLLLKFPMGSRNKADVCLLYESSMNSTAANRNIDLTQSKEGNIFKLLLGPWLFPLKLFKNNLFFKCVSYFSCYYLVPLYLPTAAVTTLSSHPWVVIPFCLIPPLPNLLNLFLTLNS